jgi:hypothetical protein
MMESLLKELSNNALTQSCIVMLVGVFVKKGAQALQTNAPPSERGAALIHIVVVAMSLIMGFLQQYLDHKLDAFDPKPWQDFLQVVMTTWGMLFAIDKAPAAANKLAQMMGLRK